jgi:hypothetical protein
MQCMEDHGAGVADFQGVLVCINCTECYEACDGANKGCQDPPLSPGACDQGSDCQACVTCATSPGGGGTGGSGGAGGGSAPGGCLAAEQTCQANPECVALRACAETCPGS